VGSGGVGPTVVTFGLVVVDDGLRVEVVGFKVVVFGLGGMVEVLGFIVVGVVVVVEVVVFGLGDKVVDVTLGLTVVGGTGVVPFFIESSTGAILVSETEQIF
jgi:hypothetical protein